MITLQDCIGLSGLDESEIGAIAEHEHVPEMIAAELGWSLCSTPDGEDRIAEMIEDDIAMARLCGRKGHCLELRDALAHFRATHPHVVH